MITFKTLLLATAVGVAAIASSGVSAATYVNADTGATTTVTTTRHPGAVMHGRTVASESMIAVGTRKVGMVGGRPYPIEATHAESTTVKATPRGVVERTEVTTSGGPINVNSTGGAYYTSTDGSYYADPAFNVDVYSTGSYND